MSKLEGNERWKSKMLLTEHQEQYDDRKTIKKTGQPTPDELTMIRDYVLLPHMMTIVQKSIDDIGRSPNTLKRLYSATAQVILNRLSKDSLDLRRELSRRNIRIMSDEQVDLIVYHRFICRGYEDRLGIVREVMRAEINVRLARYIVEIGELIQGNPQKDDRKSTV
ncbi:hypothetical protein ACFPVX_13075 [Cohnella faecalis]|uniref:Uncharacterized protein n=1 Tax=Cohnella faecalis TaxID=2315694 RepID=A0A398CXC5_9BACL|nr:hypothetical protein [Cohnella faecalis]RIE04417.1 hypothetical protein D3H35_07475 [Cohnella faecalis]